MFTRKTRYYFLAFMYISISGRSELLDAKLIVSASVEEYAIGLNKVPGEVLRIIRENGVQGIVVCSELTPLPLVPIRFVPSGSGMDAEAGEVSLTMSPRDVLFLEAGEYSIRQLLETIAERLPAFTWLWDEDRHILTLGNRGLMNSVQWPLNERISKDSIEGLSFAGLIQWLQENHQLTTDLIWGNNREGTDLRGLPPAQAVPDLGGLPEGGSVRDLLYIVISEMDIGTEWFHAFEGKMGPTEANMTWSWDLNNVDDPEAKEFDRFIYRKTYEIHNRHQLIPISEEEWRESGKMLGVTELDNVGVQRVGP